MPGYFDTIQPYNPTLRDRIGALLAGNSKQGDLRNYLTQAAIGSTGVQGNGMGLIDFTPAGAPVNAYQAGRSGAEGDWLTSALSALASVPAAGMGLLGRGLKPELQQGIKSVQPKAPESIFSGPTGWPSKPYGPDTVKNYGFPKGPGLPATTDNFTTNPAKIRQEHDTEVGQIEGEATKNAMSRRNFLGAAGGAAIAAPMIAKELPNMLHAAAKPVAEQAAPAVAQAVKGSGILNMEAHVPLKALFGKSRGRIDEDFTGNDMINMGSGELATDQAKREVADYLGMEVDELPSRIKFHPPEFLETDSSNLSHGNAIHNVKIEGLNSEELGILSHSEYGMGEGEAPHEVPDMEKVLQKHGYKEAPPRADLGINMPREFEHPDHEPLYLHSDGSWFHSDDDVGSVGAHSLNEAIEHLKGTMEDLRGGASRLDKGGNIDWDKASKLNLMYEKSLKSKGWKPDKFGVYYTHSKTPEKLTVKNGQWVYGDNLNSGSSQKSLDSFFKLLDKHLKQDKKLSGGGTTLDHVSQALKDYGWKSSKVKGKAGWVNPKGERVAIDKDGKWSHVSRGSKNLSSGKDYDSLLDYLDELPPFKK